MSRQDFIEQLQDIGYNPIIVNERLLYFEYTVPVGPNKDISVPLGFEIGNDFPMNCPHGPHFKSIRISNWHEPNKGVHSSPFGAEWRHWSRPFKEWNKSGRTVKEYMSHIRKVLVDLS